MGLNLIAVMLGVLGAADVSEAAGAENRTPWLNGPPDEVGPNYKSWRIVPDPAPGEDSNAPAGFQSASAAATPQERGVVEIATGLHYWDGQRWSPSDASFELADDSFVANRVQHRTRLSADLNVVGAVTTTLRDGTTLRSTPVAIALYDPNDGRFAVISDFTNSVGVLVASNRVVYPEAFRGGVCADVIYTLKQGSFEQDVVITGRLNPVDYGFPTNSQIQIITEFYDAPRPEKLRRPVYIEKKEAVRRRKVSPDLMDEVLGFGEFVIGTGRAFTAPTATHMNGTQAVVAKEFKTIPGEGRTFLIETLNCLSVQKALNGLPECAEGKRTAQWIRSNSSRDGYALVPKPGQSSHARARPQRSPKELARADSPTRFGVVIDYIAALQPPMPTTLRGDTTYLVSGTVYAGTIIIEGGAVLKYKAGTALLISGSVTCKTSSYRPAVFTCIDDNSIGESLVGFPGYLGTINSAGYANPALWSSWLSAPSLSNVRFCYAQEAIRLEGAYVTGTLWHAQLTHCIRGVVLMSADDGSGSGSSGAELYLTVNNGLLSDVQTMLRVANYGFGAAYFNDCTVDNCQVLVEAYENFPVTFKNSIVANILTSTGYPQLGHSTCNGFYNCNFTSFGYPAWTSPTSPFQPPGAGGAYYLKAASSFRGLGTTAGVSSSLLADLRKRTTDPPIPYAGPISSATTLSSRALQDTDALDLGYHYDPLDYLLGDITLSASLTLANGVALGLEGSSFGINLQAGANVFSTGSALILNRIAFYGNVQEQPLALVGATFMKMDGPMSSTLRFQFTDFAMRPGSASSPVLSIPANAAASGELSFRDCRLRGCQISLAPTGSPNRLSVALTNNLVEYSALTFTKGAGVPMAVSVYNNLLRGDTFALSSTSGLDQNWYIRDNLFDGTPQTISGSPSYWVVSYNGFIAGTVNSLGGTEAKTGLTAGYLSGPLGNYYYPASGGSTTLAVLINADATRTPADAGLYHYTVKTAANSKEGTETPANVDIGFHYVAVNASGNPMDTDGDGLADYLEDANGDGSFGAGDLANWNSANTDGDEANDFIECLQGRNPMSPGTMPDSSGNFVALVVY